MIRRACPPDQKNGRTPEQQAQGGIEKAVSLKELVVMRDLRRQGLSISVIAPLNIFGKPRN